MSKKFLKDQSSEIPQAFISGVVNAQQEHERRKADILGYSGSE